MTLADAYALVELNADHEKLERRNKAVAASVDRAVKTGPDAMAHLGSIALGGIPRPDGDWFVQTIRSEDQAFSALPNGFELQILALESLGGVIDPPEAARKRARASAALKGAAVLSYGVEPQLGHRKLHPRFAEIAGAWCQRAAALLETEATNLRARESWTVSSAETSLPPPADPTYPDALKKALGDIQAVFAKAVRAINRENAADREEVDILWWLQTGFSKRLATPLSHLPADQVWIEVAEDAAALANMPPPQAIIQVIDMVLRKLAIEPEALLKAGQVLGIRGRRQGATSPIASEYPMLFPTVTATSGKPEKSEWSARTGLRTSVTLNLESWTVWHYKQRALERILNGGTNAA